MNDTMKIMRMAVYNALVSGGLSVPIYDEKRKVADDKTQLYVLMAGQQEDDDDQTSETFVTNSSINLEIVHETGYEVSKDYIDDVSQEILSILMPIAQQDALPSTDDYQILGLRRRSAVTQNFSLTDDKSVVAKIITFTAKIVQRNPYFY